MINLIPSLKKFDTTDLINKAHNLRKKIGIYKLIVKVGKILAI